MTPRVLCHVNHYFGRRSAFVGGSTTGKQDERRETVIRCVAALRALPDAEVDLRVCGVGDDALLPLDTRYDLEDPTQLVYESLYDMASHVDEYDYFINVEDDVSVPPETWLNVLEFDQESLVNEILHPNRMEVDETGFRYCVDLYGNPDVDPPEEDVPRHTIRVAVTPHSGILVMSRAKLRYALSEIDRSFRGIVLPRAWSPRWRTSMPRSRCTGPTTTSRCTTWTTWTAGSTHPAWCTGTTPTDPSTTRR
jgi:hypothetical protein